jgi:hypothetical protein
VIGIVEDIVPTLRILFSNVVRNLKILRNLPVDMRHPEDGQSSLNNSVSMEQHLFELTNILVVIVVAI